MEWGVGNFGRLEAAVSAYREKTGAEKTLVLVDLRKKKANLKVFDWRPRDVVSALQRTGIPRELAVRSVLTGTRSENPTEGYRSLVFFVEKDIFSFSMDAILKERNARYHNLREAPVSEKPMRQKDDDYAEFQRTMLNSGVLQSIVRSQRSRRMGLWGDSDDIVKRKAKNGSREVVAILDYASYIEFQQRCSSKKKMMAAPEMLIFDRSDLNAMSQTSGPFFDQLQVRIGEDRARAQIRQHQIDFRDITSLFDRMDPSLEFVLKFTHRPRPDILELLPWKPSDSSFLDFRSQLLKAADAANVEDVLTKLDISNYHPRHPSPEKPPVTVLPGPNPGELLVDDVLLRLDDDQITSSRHGSVRKS